MPLPPDYLSRVYAGVLGKIIGVYLGRPFEGWTYDRILAELGEINYYVHQRRGVSLVVTDDDITGTFTFLRALSDYGTGRALTPAQMGATWLNYIVERQSILWWGGFGISTEHTAYVRLKHGLLPPHSGSIATNGQTVAEQIGAQIFIDGWGMVAPSDPELAAALARTAGCVSHDGEAIYGAQVIAALEAQAFVESDLNKLLDVATGLIPRDSLTYRLIADVREWHQALPDWRVARERIAARYGYDKFPGSCHVIPNHALIHLGLLYGEDDFQKSLMITNTSGWDTDCNSGNVGCILGIKNGLAALDSGPDWRGPVADRLYLPTADGGRCVSDALQESVRIVNLGRQLHNTEPLALKGGARFHFEAPGAVQGFTSHSPELRLHNVAGHSAHGTRALALHYTAAPGATLHASTPTFIRPDDLTMPGYPLHGSPTLYPGQTARARLSAEAPAQITLVIYVYAAGNQTRRVFGPTLTLTSGAAGDVQWRVPACDAQPIQAIGLEIKPGAETGTVFLDELTWAGAPDAEFRRPAEPDSPWPRAWVSAVDDFSTRWPESFRVIHNEGRGLVIQGAREWQGYRVEANIKPLLCAAAGIAACVQGLRRYYALLLAPNHTLRLIKVLEREYLLAEAPFEWAMEQTYRLALEVDGEHLRAFANDQPCFAVTDPDLPSGAIALVVEDGSFATQVVTVKPLPSSER